MSTDLRMVQKRCQPCEGYGKALDREDAIKLLEEIPQWKISMDAKSIHRHWVMKNFKTAIDFINKITELAEDENHHPDIHLTGYRNLRIELSTHTLDGLTENDFILAAKIDALPAHIKKIN